ncbi:hypothetical protein GCM10010191_05460 [Actinomadura vinacea]|uniref:Protein kinase domain-containing protein n=1 Tax=Actinomadura vinacea TaxID=115336 RepID=A0ABP5VIN0_9ACTN
MEPLGADDPTRIGGFELIARLGAGGMGRVFLGRAASGDLVAVKVIHARFAQRADRRERFAREIHAAGSIDPAYVAPIVDHDLGADEPWLATAYLPGLTLRQAVELHGPLPGPAVRALAVALARALTAIHGAGVLHRDLKPSNLVLTSDGPRVVDFGVARPDGTDTITMPGAVLGTPGYIPPERIRDRRSDAAGDVFALGAVLVYAATGEGPFGTGSAQVLLYRTQFQEPSLDGLETALDDPELTELIARCLARDPGRRPPPDEIAGRFAGAPALAGVRWLPQEVAAGVSEAGGTPQAAVRSWFGPRTRRRTVLALVAATAVVAPLGAVAHGASVGRPRRPSRSRSPLWSYASPDAENRHWFNRPTVAGDRVYLSSTKGIHALSCGEGRVLWTASRGVPVFSGVAVMEQGTVLLSDGQLWALAASDGSPLPQWSNTTVGRTGTPAVVGGLTLVCDSAGRLVAYDRLTGRRRWDVRLVTPGPDKNMDPFPGDGIDPFPVNGMRRVDHAGRRRFGSAPVPMTTAGWRVEGALDPVYAGGLIYVAPGGLFAVDPAARAVRWRFAEATGAPAVRGGLLYTAGADHVHAIDAASGARRWSRDVGAMVSSGVTVTDGLVLAGDDTGRLHALDAGTGRPRWRFDTYGPLRATLAAAAGAVYAGSDGDRLYAIETADGSLRWSRPVGRQTRVHPEVWRDRVFVCVDLTHLYAFRL